MSAALTVQPRHLDLPLGALFSPIEMQIGPSTSQAEYQKLGAGLRKLDNASELWTADFSLFGVRTWGKEQGLQLAHDATGLSKFFLYKTSFVAARFTPEHRLPGYKYSAYRELMPFPPEWAYAFLSRHVGEKLSSRSLRALAVKEFGSEPYKTKQPKKRNVSIRCELYARLAQHSPSQKVATFIENICEEWLRHREGPPLTQTERNQRYRERHPDYLRWSAEQWREYRKTHPRPAATTYHDNLNVRRPEPVVDEEPSIEDIEAAIRARNPRRNGGNEPDATCPSPQPSAAPNWRPFSEAREYVRSLKLSGCAAWYVWSRSRRPVDIPARPRWIYKDSGWDGFPDWLGCPTPAERAAARAQARAEKRSEREQERAAKREAAQAAKKAELEQKRATYEERRRQQIAAGAKPIPVKKHKQRKGPLRLQWTECRPGKSFLDSENGAAQFLGRGSEKAQKFYSEADAIAAEQRHFDEKGFRERVIHCDVCQCWHVQHIFTSEVRQRA
jgi:hypothetical protein